MSGIHRNFRGSAERFGDDIMRVVEDPVGSLESLGKVVAGYACQAVGAESEYTEYSKAVTEYLGNRYGSWEKFKYTLATDPAAVAMELSACLTVAGLAARAGALGLVVGSTITTRAAPLVANLAPAMARALIKAGEKAGGMSGTMTSAARGLQRAGDLTDPLYYAGKGALMAGQGAGGLITPTMRQAARKLGERTRAAASRAMPEKARKIAAKLEPAGKTLILLARKAALLAARRNAVARSALGAMGTQQSVERSREEQSSGQ